MRSSSLMLFAGNGEFFSDRAVATAVISCQPTPSSSQKFATSTVAASVRDAGPDSSHSSRPALRPTAPALSPYPLESALRGTRVPLTLMDTVRAIAEHCDAA